MKVYVITSVDYDDFEVLAVCSTKERADQWLHEDRKEQDRIAAAHRAWTSLSGAWEAEYGIFGRNKHAPNKPPCPPYPGYPRNTIVDYKEHELL